MKRCVLFFDEYFFKKLKSVSHVVVKGKISAKGIIIGIIGIMSSRKMVSIPKVEEGSDQYNTVGGRDFYNRI